MFGFRMLLPVLVAVGCWLLLCPMAALAADAFTARARAFVKDHERRIRPLDIAVNIAWWNANTSGKDEDFERKEKAQNRLDAALANKKIFAEVKDLKDHRNEIDDAVTRRAIDVLYLLYLEKQVDASISSRGSRPCPTPSRRRSTSSGPRSTARR